MWTRSDSIEVGLCSKIRIIFSRYTSCLSNKDTHTRHSLYDNRQSGLKAVSRRASRVHCLYENCPQVIAEIRAKIPKMQSEKLIRSHISDVATFSTAFLSFPLDFNCSSIPATLLSLPRNICAHLCLSQTKIAAQRCIAKYMWVGHKMFCKLPGSINPAIIEGGRAIKSIACPHD